MAAGVRRARRLHSEIIGSLGFLPTLILAVFAAGGAVLVQVDESVVESGIPVIFEGDADAARTLLSVIAGSLITVAGLVFSMTLVVLQLASTQFSPRVLRTFFGDRLTQVTIGTYVGTFAFALVVLRSVGAPDGGQFVPRLSVTVASALGLAAVVLLIVFLHHVSQLIQVSHVMRSIAGETLARLERTHPDAYAGPQEAAAADALLERWRGDAEPAQISSAESGFVQHVDVGALLDDLAGRAERVAMLVRPGDFVSLESPLAEVWPSDAFAGCAGGVRAAVEVGPERTLGHDVDFGIRQLTDTAVRAMSPSINDPTTAVTCVGYLRSILVALSGRALPGEIHRRDDGQLTVVAARRTFREHLEALHEVARHGRDDPRVSSAVVRALRAVASTAATRDADERVAAAERLAETIADRSSESIGDAVHPAAPVSGQTIRRG